MLVLLIDLQVGKGNAQLALMLVGYDDEVKVGQSLR